MPSPTSDPSPPNSNIRLVDTSQLETRAIVACVFCRQRKIKCSGDKPVCVKCRKMGLECVYPAKFTGKRNKGKRKEGEDAVEGTGSDGRNGEVKVNDYVGQASNGDGAKRRKTEDAAQIYDQREVERQSLGKPEESLNPVASTHNPIWQQPVAPPRETTFSMPTTTQTINNSNTTQAYPSALQPPQKWNYGIPEYSPSASSQLSLNHNPTTVPYQAQPTFGPPHSLNPTRHHPQPVASTSTQNWHSTRTPSQTYATGGGVSAQNANGNHGSHQSVTMALPQLGDGPSPSSGRRRIKMRVPFFRYFGATAIAPGFRKVICDVSAPPSPTSKAMEIHEPAQSALVFNDEGERPHDFALEHLIPIFREHFGYFFPFLRLTPDDLPILPAHLLNIVCALAARFSPLYSSSQSSLEIGGVMAPMDIWAMKSKEQAGKQLAVSSPDLVTSLLLISWFEFGADRDGGLWMYSGMASRMAEDLGLKSFDNDVPEGTPGGAADMLDRKRLHWACCMMDSIMTIGTGRRGVYCSPDTVIQDLVPLAADTLALPDPYPYMVRIFILADQVTSVLIKNDAATLEIRLEDVRTRLNTFCLSLPPQLQFQTSTFRQYVPLNQGAAFVLIHFWLHTLLILVHQPSVIWDDDDHRIPAVVDVASEEIALSSARTILDIASFSELIDQKAITQPWINYPLYTATRTFIKQSIVTEDTSTSAFSALARRALVVSTAKSNYERLIQIMTVLLRYWGGVRYIQSVLVQKAHGSRSLTLVPDEALAQEPEPQHLAQQFNISAIPGIDLSSRDPLGVGLTGTMNSPSNNEFTLMFPTNPTNTAHHDLFGFDEMPIMDSGWAENFLAGFEQYGQLPQ